MESLKEIHLVTKGDESVGLYDSKCRFIFDCPIELKDNHE